MRSGAPCFASVCLRSWGISDSINCIGEDVVAGGANWCSWVNVELRMVVLDVLRVAVEISRVGGVAATEVEVVWGGGAMEVLAVTD